MGYTFFHITSNFYSGSSMLQVLDYLGPSSISSSVCSCVRGGRGGRGRGWRRLAGIIEVLGYQCKFNYNPATIHITVSSIFTIRQRRETTGRDAYMNWNLSMGSWTIYICYYYCKAPCRRRTFVTLRRTVGNVSASVWLPMCLWIANRRLSRGKSSLSQRQMPLVCIRLKNKKYQ